MRFTKRGCDGAVPKNRHQFRTTQQPAKTAAAAQTELPPAVRQAAQVRTANAPRNNAHRPNGAATTHATRTSRVTRTSVTRPAVHKNATRPNRATTAAHPIERRALPQRLSCARPSRRVRSALPVILGALGARSAAHKHSHGPGRRLRPAYFTEGRKACPLGGAKASRESRARNRMCCTQLNMVERLRDWLFAFERRGTEKQSS